MRGSGWDFDIALHTGAGRYICGEETALINSLEGKRANPRAKPPFPGQSGAWGLPTVVNNVETLCNVPGIVNHGADWFQALSGDLSSDGGTKLYGVSGKVKTPGLWELPMGTTGNRILELAGGMRDGLTLKSWLPGGGSTGFLLPEHLELRNPRLGQLAPKDERRVRHVHSSVGHGGEGTLQPVEADVAVRADDVRDHLDLHA